MICVVAHLWVCGIGVGVQIFGRRWENARKSYVVRCLVRCVFCDDSQFVGAYRTRREKRTQLIVPHERRKMKHRAFSKLVGIRVEGVFMLHTGNDDDIGDIGVVPKPDGNAGMSAVHCREKERNHLLYIRVV